MGSTKGAMAACARAGEWAQALELLRRLRDDHDLAAESRHYEAAVRAYTDALNIDARADSVNSVLRCNRAAARLALGQHAEALDALAGPWSWGQPLPVWSASGATRLTKPHIIQTSSGATASASASSAST